MKLVLLTALGVGGATVFGALLGFLWKKTSHRSSDVILSFAAGVMMAASVFSLLLPAIEETESNYNDLKALYKDDYSRE